MRNLLKKLTCSLSVASISIFVSSNSYSEGCGDYIIRLHNSTGSTCTFTEVNLEHGTFYAGRPMVRWNIPKVGDKLINSEVYSIYLIQSSYGPSLVLALDCENGKTIHIRSQQNYCMFQAGDIHTNILSNKGIQAVAINSEGSYSNQDPGSTEWELQ